MHEEQENAQERLEIEISDLPTIDLDQRAQQLLRMGQHVHTFRQQMQRQQSHFLSALSLLCVLLTAFLLNGSQLYRPIVTPQSTTATSASIILGPNGPLVTTQLRGSKTIVSWTKSDGTWIVESATLPAECGQGSAIGNIHLIGHYPVWIAGLMGPNANVQLTPHNKLNEQPWVGWDVPFSAEIIHGVHGPVTFSFIGLSAGLPPLLSTPIDGIYSSVITFNPDFPISLMVPNTDKAISTWNFKLHLGNPGCYLASADWPSGHWSIIFIAR